MGKTVVQHFTKDQRIFLDTLRQYPAILQKFYLTGGTALAACYYNHRFSEDIDLFTSELFDHTWIIKDMKEIAKQLHAKTQQTKIFDSLQYILTYSSGSQLKVEFVPYRFDQIEKPLLIDGLSVDSIEDIAVNKLLAINQRTASKDFVDLFYILKRFTLWDLRIGVEHKFGMEMEPLYISSLLKKADELTDLPIMKKKLTLEQLKTFFLKEAKRLAMTMVKP